MLKYWEAMQVAVPAEQQGLAFVVGVGACAKEDNLVTNENVAGFPTRWLLRLSSIQRWIWHGIVNSSLEVEVPVIENTLCSGDNCD
eukprot:6483691-Amphidinium_carterae.3